MRLQVIAEGSSWWDRFIRRWGVSFLIDEDTLFDTFGDPSVFLNNARKMNIDFSRIRYIVLSHDDWDHASGLWWVINKHKNLSVYVCPGTKKETKERIKSFGVNVIQTSLFQEIRNNIYSTGELISNPKGEVIHEQSLVVKSQNGVSIITGCAHHGIINILKLVTKEFGIEINFVLGGFHLKDSSRDEVNAAIQELKSYKIKHIAPTHCTGKYATGLLEKEFGTNFLRVKQGCVFDI